jgi:hypothetical protein
MEYASPATAVSQNGEKPEMLQMRTSLVYLFCDAVKESPRKSSCPRSPTQLSERGLSMEAILFTDMTLVASMAMLRSRSVNAL